MKRLTDFRFFDCLVFESSTVGTCVFVYINGQVNFEIMCIEKSVCCVSAKEMQLGESLFFIFIPNQVVAIL